MSTYVLQVSNATAAIQAQVESAFRKDPKAFAANIQSNPSALGLPGDSFNYTLSVDGASVGGQAQATNAGPMIHLGADEIPAATPALSGFAQTYNRTAGSGSAPAAVASPVVSPAASDASPASGTQELYPSGSPQAADVDQGGINDCALDSQLAGLANGNPSLITNMIQANAGGGYDVTLYPNGQKASFHVSDADLAASQTVGGDGKKNWASVIEAATIKAGQDYSTGANPCEIAQLLTGQANNLVGTASLDKNLSQLQATLAAGKSVTASASVSTGDIHGHHGYTVLSIAGDQVTIRNPLGGGVQSLSAAQFLSDFDAVYI